jgi:hypothetical protein
VVKVDDVLRHLVEQLGNSVGITRTSSGSCKLLCIRLVSDRLCADLGSAHGLRAVRCRLHAQSDLTRSGSRRRRDGNHQRAARRAAHLGEIESSAALHRHPAQLGRPDAVATTQGSRVSDAKRQKTHIKALRAFPVYVGCPETTVGCQEKTRTMAARQAGQVGTLVFA